MGTVVPVPKRELDPQVIGTALGRDPEASAESQRSAFAHLYRHFEPRVRYAVAKAAMKARYKHAIADVRQEVWCRLARPRSVLRYYDPERGTFGSFISRVAYQQALAIIHAELRKAGDTAQFDTFEEEEAENSDELQNDAKLIQSDFYHKLIARAAEELDEEERVMLHQIYFENRSAQAVAAARGINKNTIYKRHQRLKDKLRAMATELLDQLEPDQRPPSSTVAAIIALVSASLAAPVMDGTKGPSPSEPSSDDALDPSRLEPTP